MRHRPYLVASAPFVDPQNFKLETTYVNGQPGYIISVRSNDGWKFDTIFSFEFMKGKIVRIFAQRNPDKLAVLARSDS